ncbi:MAG: hypothetical protein MI924_05045 [Chloroflexales bacterium]|nr:hypothetical protein [Chloroflexales bacterium]
MLFETVKKWGTADRTYWSAWVTLCTLGWLTTEGVLAVKGVSSIGPNDNTTFFLGAPVSIFATTSLFFLFPCLLLFVAKAQLIRACIDVSAASIVFWTLASSSIAAFFVSLLYHRPFVERNWITYIVAGLIVAVTQWISLRIHSKKADEVLIGTLVATLLAIFIPVLVPPLRIIAGFIYGSVSGVYIVNQRNRHEQN